MWGGGRGRLGAPDSVSAKKGSRVTRVSLSGLLARLTLVVTR